MAKTTTKRTTTPEPAPSPEPAAPIEAPAVATGAPIVLATYGLDQEAEAHASLEEILKQHPRAECRSNHRGSGKIEIWSGPAA